MINFLCFSISQESYFLIVNYFSSTILLFWLALPISMLWKEENFHSEFYLLVANLSGTVALFLLNVSIFLHYSIKPDIYSNYIRLYTICQLSFVLLLIITCLGLIGFELYKEAAESWIYIILMALFELYLLTLFYLSRNLKIIISVFSEYSDDEDFEFEDTDDSTELEANRIDLELEKQINNESY